MLNQTGRMRDPQRVNERVSGVSLCAYAFALLDDSSEGCTEALEPG